MDWLDSLQALDESDYALPELTIDDLIHSWDWSL